MVYRLPGAFPANPFPHDVNGSLWTLPIELRLYVALLVAGVLGIARAALVVARDRGVALVAVFAWRPEWFPLAPNDSVVRELALLFALGSLACVWRDALPVSLAGAVAAAVLVAWNPARLARGAPVRAAARVRRAGGRLSPALAMAAFNRARRLLVRPLRVLVSDAADADAAIPGARAGRALRMLAAARRSPSPHCRGMRSKRRRSH